MEARDPKTQQQKLLEAFIHLSLQVYHHNPLSQMFRYSLQWVALSPRPPLLSFLAVMGMWWYEVTAGSSFVPYLKQCPGFLTWCSVLILLCEQKLRKNQSCFTQRFWVIMEDCFVGKTAALLCKSQPSPETWASLSYNLSAIIDEITDQGNKT